EESGGAEVHPPADPRAEPPEIPGEERSALERLERERGDEEFVESVYELEPPDERAPERMPEGAEPPHDDPLDQRHAGEHRRAARRVDHGQRQERPREAEPLPEGQGRYDDARRDEDEPGRRQGHPEDLHQGPDEPPGAGRTEGPP